MPLKKQLDNGKIVTYKLKFIDSYRFMSTSSSILVNNLSEGLHNDKCQDCKSYLDYMLIKDDKKKDFNKELIKRFENIYEFCNNNIIKFILLLRKGVYPYECMDSWERFEETALPDKEAFYSSLNMEDITDIDYRHAKIVLKNLNYKNLGDYHDLYLQSDYYLLMYLKILEMCLKEYKLDPAHFLSAPGLAWQACFLKKQE